MGQGERGLQLRCRDGHFEMAPFELKRQEGGYWLWVACDFDGHAGGHWLAPDPRNPGRIAVGSKPYHWPDPVTAFAARDQWEQQEEG